MFCQATGKPRQMNSRAYFTRFLMPFAVLMSVLPVSGSAETFFASPDNYRVVIDQLGPGDILQLSPGDYREGLNILGLAGNVGLPITITGPEDENSAIFHGRPCCNTVQIQDSSYVTIKWLKLDGGNVGGIDGVNGRGVTHHITIENLLIVGHGNDQQDVGISTKGTAWDWVVRGNILLEPGTGMYFGDSDGSAPFVRGLIEYNYVEDSIGYNIEIKHQNLRPTDVGLPADVSDTVIRHNVFTKENNYSVGGLARPNLLVGHFPDTGDGSNDTYQIYGNFLYENPSEALFQGEGNINFHNNILFNSYGDAIQIVPHNGRPRNIIVAFNTVVAAGQGINISGAESGYQQLTVGNMVFSYSGISSPVQRDNIVDEYAAADAYLEAPFSALGAKSLFPLAGAAQGPDISFDGISDVLDINRDFNGTERGRAFRGAYAGEGSNPGWILARAQKYTADDSVAPPVVDLATDKQSIPVTESVLLSWSSTNAESCVASGSWSGEKSISGSESVIVNDVGDNQFILKCDGQGGSATATIIVTGEPAPSNPPPPPSTVDDESAGNAGGGSVSILSLFLILVVSIRRAISTGFVATIRNVP